MKKLLLATTLIALTLPASAKIRPIDGDMRHVTSIEGANAFADYVEAVGYRCDSITSFMPALFSSRKFTLKCNGYRYVYDIEDRGGRWVVTID